MRSFRFRVGYASVVVTALCIASAGCKEVTETVVEKGVKAAKDTTRGVSEGIEKGRKQGQSPDDAVVVSRPEEIKGKGAITVRALRQHPENPKHAQIELAFENTSERPLRFTKLEVLALDAEAFVNRPRTQASDVTVLPKTKDKLVVAFEADAKTLTKVRVWGVEHKLPAVQPATD
ncbi:MAG TPA: hypothetical protein VI072_30840 [Polyangiaceae bacterium]